MDTSNSKKIPLFQLQLSSIRNQALKEMKENGAVKARCPQCGEVLEVKTEGRYKERTTIRCKCGLMDDIYLGI